MLNTSQLYPSTLQGIRLANVTDEVATNHLQ
jgi:hypothetical protein